MVELEDTVARMQALMRELKKEQNVNGKLNATHIHSFLTGGSGWATMLEKLLIDHRFQRCQTRNFRRANEGFESVLLTARGWLIIGTHISSLPSVFLLDVLFQRVGF